MMNRLARPVLNSVRTSAGPVTPEVRSAWYKASFLIGPVMVIPAFMVMEIRHPHIQLRPPANSAPWINILDDKMPWEGSGKKTPFFHDDYNTIAQRVTSMATMLAVSSQTKIIIKPRRQKLFILSV